MPRRATFLPYRPKTILNKAKRADHWFWTRYSAYPYLGCQHGCEFCYCREQKYSPHDDPDDFAYVIKVKENAPDLLRKALAHAPREVIFTGDYQPAERRFGLSRRMLDVCLELGFPVFILSRSPLVLRDLDLLVQIRERAAVTVAFSIIAAPDSAHYREVCRMERLAPPSARRFEAMQALAEAGIPTGACAMPLLPGLCDDDPNLDGLARWTAAHGGSFVLAGGLTLADQQKDFFFDVLNGSFPDLVELYRRLYPPGSYGPSGLDPHDLARRVRAACQRHGLPDRMPRPLIPGEKRARNKRLVELLANEAYTLELDGAPESQVWERRKAAWALEDLEQDVGLILSSLGSRGLESIPGISPDMAAWISGRVTSP
jgi:DNA repair photolyase